MEHKMKTLKDLGARSTESEKSYMNGMGAYQKENDSLYDKLVPSRGCASTLHGELVRAANRLYYEYTVNGNCNAVRDVFDHVEVSFMFQNFLDLIDETLEKEILPDEVYGITGKVREIILESVYELSDYFSDENIQQYDRLMDAVMWYVLNTEDGPVPLDYENK